MDLIGPTPFLILEHGPDGRKSALAIVRKRTDVIQRWNSSTRISPLFCTKKAGRSKSSHSYSFPGDNFVFFIGPVAFGKIRQHLTQTTQVWAALGLRNVILLTQHKQEANSIKESLKQQSIGFEEWFVRNGIVEKMPAAGVQIIDKNDRIALKKLAEGKYPVEMNEAIHEFCPLIASILTRSQHLPVGLRKDLRLILSQLTKEFTELVFKPYMTDQTYVSYRTFKGLNAGLSRFAAQSLSALPRIVDSDCHYWSHSLLGIGTANIALWNLQAFLREQILQTRLFERFEKYCSWPNRNNVLHHGWQNIDLVKDVTFSNTPDSTYDPLVTYFSSRDGFLNKGQTISAPLASVGAGNCSHWSLMTLTHELSHILISPIISIILPKIEAVQEVEELVILLGGTSVGSTNLEEIRRVFTRALHSLDTVIKKEEPLQRGRRKTENIVTVDSVYDLFQNYRDYIEEIMVHTFDFAYFYGRDAKRYVNGIWSSWRAIPNLSSERLSNYVIRTISAIMLRHLHKGNPDICAKRDLIQIFSELEKDEQGTKYIKQALDILRNDWESKIQPRLIALKYFVSFCNDILFSETLATALLKDTFIGSGAGGKKQGYKFSKGNLDIQISNPVRFLKLYSTDAEACHRTSAWIYYVLAHNYDAPT